MKCLFMSRWLCCCVDLYIGTARFVILNLRNQILNLDFKTVFLPLYLENWTIMNESDNIIDRINSFIEESNLTRSQFADACGIPRPTISQMLSGKNKKLVTMWFLLFIKHIRKFQWCGFCLAKAKNLSFARLIKLVRINYSRMTVQILWKMRFSRV